MRVLHLVLERIGRRAVVASSGHRKRGVLDRVVHRTSVVDEGFHRVLTGAFGPGHPVPFVLDVGEEQFRHRATDASSPEVFVDSNGQHLDDDSRRAKVILVLCLQVGDFLLVVTLESLQQARAGACIIYLHVIVSLVQAAHRVITTIVGDRPHPDQLSGDLVQGDDRNLYL